MTDNLDLTQLTAADIQNAYNHDMRAFSMSKLDVRYAQFIRKKYQYGTEVYLYLLVTYVKADNKYRLYQARTKILLGSLDVDLSGGRLMDFDNLPDAVVYAEYQDRFFSMTWAQLEDIFQRAPRMLKFVIAADPEQHAQLEFLMNQAEARDGQ